MYKYTQSGDIYVVSIANHSDLTAALTAFCEEQRILSGKIDGIGAVSSATLRFYDPTTKKYVDRTFEEQMEIAALVGNISEKEGKVYLHLHATLGRSDYTSIAGHLLTAQIHGACELFIRRLHCPLGREYDPETSLQLYVFQS